jgi:hypothetical protein
MNMPIAYCDIAIAWKGRLGTNLLTTCYFLCYGITIQDDLVVARAFFYIFTTFNGTTHFKTCKQLFEHQHLKGIYTGDVGLAIFVERSDFNFSILIEIHRSEKLLAPHPLCKSSVYTGVKTINSSCWRYRFQ